jgi:hypothetical protein
MTTIIIEIIDTMTIIIDTAKITTPQCIDFEIIDTTTIIIEITNS